jgi:25S rRNA (uracil2843-N3)-methyltransferase
VKLQQQCLDIFRDALKSGPDDQTVLQEVKGHLYNRDFATAFGREEYLRVYAARWSPSRALGYLQIFRDLDLHLNAESASDNNVMRVICLGGGAGGELVGLAGWNCLQREEMPATDRKLEVTLVDIARWSPVVDGLAAAITTAPELSRYASQAKKDSNRPLVYKDNLSTFYQQADLLQLEDQECASLMRCIAEADLVTIMFTLNELYTTSMPRTQQLLSRLTEAMTPGSYLLVVDSPGSYSTVSVNGAAKKYPMQWLLDHTLLGWSGKQRDDESSKLWVKVDSEDSRWFRLDDSLHYPIELENMRYQIHLYRRTGVTGE